MANVLSATEQAYDSSTFFFLEDTLSIIISFVYLEWNLIFWWLVPGSTHLVNIKTYWSLCKINCRITFLTLIVIHIHSEPWINFYFHMFLIPDLSILCKFTRHIVLNLPLLGTFIAWALLKESIISMKKGDSDILDDKVFASKTVVMDLLIVPTFYLL